jgi:heme/copper-type cytochrome/quinol oxidase subunit 2
MTISPMIRSVLPVGLLVLLILIVPVRSLAAPTTRYLSLDANQFQFTPGRVHVNQGDRVVITLTASDVVHGFYLDGYGLQTRVEPGVSQRIEFIADRPGKFRYRCSVTCGPIHPFMIGELVVGPNIPFWKTSAVMLVAASGMLVHLWQTNQTKRSLL